MLDELELKRHDATLTAEERAQGVGEFIELVGAVDSILQAQARADAAYFAATCGRTLPAAEAAEIGRQFRKAYRWQYIFSGAGHPHFQGLLAGLAGPAGMTRIEAALAGLA